MEIKRTFPFWEGLLILINILIIFFEISQYIKTYNRYYLMALITCCIALVFSISAFHQKQNLVAPEQIEKRMKNPEKNSEKNAE